MLMAANDFQTFGTAHLWAMATIAVVPVVLILLCRRSGSAAVSRWVRWGIAAALILTEISYYWYAFAVHGVAYFLEEALPLHICGIGLFLTAWVLVRPSQMAYETAYYWGLGGTIQAILTPNLTYAFPHIRFFQFFCTHGGIVTGVLVATFVMRMRPGRGSILRTFLLTNALLLVVAHVNAALGANYMFLCEPPEGDSFFFFLPWPWYVLFLQPVGVAFCMIFYAPFWWADRMRRRREGGRLTEVRAVEA